MKKVLLWLLFVIIMFAVFVFGTIGYAYYKAEPTLPELSVKLGDSSMAYNGYSWNESVLNGLLYKEMSAAISLATDKLGTLETLTPNIAIDSKLTATIIITDKNKKTVFSGTPDEYKAFAFTENGDYKIKIKANIPPLEGKSYGEFNYDGVFTINVQPTIEISADKQEQGGTFSVVVSNILGDMVPVVETELSASLFTEKDNVYTALVGVAYNREPGKYDISVRLGDNIQSFEVQVIHHDFDRQDLTMGEAISNATNTPAAYKEFNEKVTPLYSVTSPDTYWEGRFVQPCEGRITSEYGLRRYTNGATTPVRHAGIDIACPTGTPVVAPNNGKVLLAELLLNTGNTVVIDHGAGLKSYFFHMDSLATTKDTIIMKGDKVGEVGTTGYSTGPHLHYDVRIGNQSINPWQLFDGSSAVFFKKDQHNM